MNTQNTPVHINLWHKDFWLMSTANLLLTMSVYIFIPVLPALLLTEEHFTPLQTGFSMGVFGLGLFFFGASCSYFVQHFRRNVVCIYSIVGIIAITSLIYYMQYVSLCMNFTYMTVLRFFQGAFYGLAQMVLSSTLIIDTSESFQRTEANHSSSWFGRFGLSLGPTLGLTLYHLPEGMNLVLIGSVVCGVLSVLLIMSVNFPFRIPDDDVKFFSLDRFFLPQGTWLFVNLMIITTMIGVLFSIPQSEVFYGMIMVGFLLTLVARKFVFVNAELESEVITGLIAIGVALLMMLTRHQVIVSYMSPLFIGFGIGIIASRFLLFFIKLSRHCQRGTSQSTFLLAWESGLALGLFIGYSFLCNHYRYAYMVALGLTVAALIMYHFFTHQWFLKHKNR
jgi:MFS family permease